MTGNVLRFERASIHDGPGLRTVVFLKGCPLGCLWCSTPESQRGEPQTCPDGRVYGRVMQAEDVLAEILKDEVFYFHSEGGVTLSGGEPLAQPGFTAEILRQCRQAGIHTALETSLFAPFEAAAQVLPHVDHLFADIKHADPAEHLRLAGVDNGLILQNLGRLTEAGFKGDLVIRVPLIPGLNDGDDNLGATAAIAASLPGLRYVELLPYHRLGLESYRRLGLTYALPHIKTPSRAHMLERAAFMEAAAPGVRVKTA